jgi:hypothetical protein
MRKKVLAEVVRTMIQEAGPERVTIARSPKMIPAV